MPHPETGYGSRDRVPEEPSRASENKNEQRPVQRGKDCSVHQQFHAQSLGRICEKKDVRYGVDHERDENASNTNHPFEQDLHGIFSLSVDWRGDRT